MNIQEFIENFADQLDDVDATTISTDTVIRELNEWSSLAALSVMAMVSDEYDVELTAEEMRGANTINDLFNIINSHM